MKPTKIIEFIENWASINSQLSWDNSGIQIYSGEDTENIVIAMDLTDNVVNFALEKNSKFILTHHPLFFKGVKSIDNRNYRGELLFKLIGNGINVYSAHTSLDIALDGVNYELAKRLELKNPEPLSIEEDLELGLVGDLSWELSPKDFLKYIDKYLSIDKIKAYGRIPSKISKVALLGGAGGEYVQEAVEKNADVLITGDVSHHDGQAAYEEGILLIDLDHYNSEFPILKKLSREISVNLDIDSYVYEKNDFYVEIGD